MKSFFDAMEPWRKSEGSLHLYVLPDEEESERFVAAQEALAGIANLPLMPAPYLHCTVQRLAQFDEDISQSEFSRLGDALGKVCAELPPFALDLKAPRADETAVVCWGDRSQDWNRLVQGCLQTVTETWGGETPAPPSGPHVSLAYANGPVDRDLVGAQLANVEPPGTLHARTLHLVSVTVRPARGTFDFTELANWDLGS